MSSTSNDTPVGHCPVVFTQDDIIINTRLVRKLLEDEGYTVIENNDIRRALGKIADVHPDIIFSDILEPGFDGLQLLRLIKENERTRHIPFCFLTSLNDEETIKKANEFGAAAYLNKPCNKEELLSTIKRLTGYENASAGSLYKELKSGKYSGDNFKLDNHGEGMYVLCQAIWGYWKPRFLIDENAKTAVEFMSEYETLLTVCRDDIDFESFSWQGENCVYRAETRNAHFPTLIGKFVNGVAEVDWQLNPDGMYYMDSDGFGMSDDEEVTIVGYIGRDGRVLSKFQYFRKGFERFEEKRAEAEEKVKRR